MFFNKVLVTNPDPSVLEKKINRTTLDIYYLASLLEEELLDSEDGETVEETSAALKELESTLAVMKAEHEAVVAIQKYFFVKEAAEASEDSDVPEEVSYPEDDVPEPDVPESDEMADWLASGSDLNVLSPADIRILTTLQDDSRSNLYKHAERELLLRGDDKEFTDMFLNMITCFSSYGHSGSSAQHSITTLERLLRWENLTELTNNPDEWNLVSRGSTLDDLLWQNKRNPKAFTTDPEFYTYYLNGDRNTLIQTERFDFS